MDMPEAHQPSTSRITCFKYRSGESALQCLREGTLYFAAPNTLNDTLEASFDHKDIEDDLHILKKTFEQIGQARGERITWEFDRTGLEELINVTNRENSAFSKFCEIAGIFSGAQRPDNQALWAYYADSCRGFCFELEWDLKTLDQYQLFPAQVRYSNAPRRHSRMEDWRNALLELAAERPSLTIQELQQISLGETFRRRQGIRSTIRALSIKHTDWQHENEIRLIAPKARSIPALKNVLKRVHFIRRDCPYWGETLKTLYLQYPSVELIHWQFHHGTITAQASVQQLRSIPIVD